MNNIYLMSIFSCLCVIKVVTQNFAVNLSDSLLLNQNYSGITNIGLDFQGNFLVGFLDGTARKYSSDFSSYTNFYVPQVVDYFRTREITGLNINLSNGSVFSFASRKIMITTNTFKTMRDYNYATYVEEDSQVMNETIISQLGFTIVISNVPYTYHVFICNSSVIVTYRGVVVSYTYGSIVGSSSNCIAATYYSYSFNTGTTNKLKSIMPFYISLGVNVYKVTITLTFTFNFTSNNFDFATTFTQSSIFTSTAPVTSLSVSNGLLMMQSSSNWASTIFDTTSNSLVASGAPLQQIFSFFYAYSSYYVLQSTGIVKMKYNSTSLTLTNLLKTSTLPSDTYNLMVSNPVNPFYIPGMPYIYKSGICSGQSAASGVSCVNYNCTTPNCSFCPISSLVCSICNTGFAVDAYYICRAIPANTTNSTATNTTSANTTANSTSTNTTANSTATNSTSNSTIPSPSISYDQSPLYSFFKMLLQYLLNLLRVIISIPAARRAMSPVFYYFGIFDDLYLFQFHDRVYGDTMQSIFMNINSIQSEKWSMLNYQTVLTWFSVDEGTFQNVTDYQNTYNSFNFTDDNHTDVGSQGVWANCQNFFIVALPITIFGFLIGKVLFKILFNSVLSKFFRRFDFWSLLILLLLDGNIQEFSFYLTTQWKNIFFFDASSKFIKIQAISFGFLIIISSTALYFLSYNFYSRLNKHIMDNNKNIILGQSSLIVQFGLRNLYFGMLHSSLRVFSYNIMLSVLLASEVFFIIFFVYSISKKVYEYTLKMWIYILLNFTKILLIVTLYIDMGNVNVQAVESTQQVLIISILGIFAVGCIIEAYLTFKDIFQFVRIITTYWNLGSGQERKDKRQKSDKFVKFTKQIEAISKYSIMHLSKNNKNKTTFMLSNSHFQAQKSIEKEVFNMKSKFKKCKPKGDIDSKSYLKVHFKDFKNNTE